MSGRVIEEVLAELDPSGFEEGDGGGSSEGKVALFRALFDEFVRGVGLVDGADTGGPDFQEQDVSKLEGLQPGDRALVLPEVVQVLTQGEGGDGEQRAVEDPGGRGDAGDGEVEAVVVDRAEPGKDQRAIRIVGGEVAGAEEGGQVEALAFDKEALDGGGFLETEVASVCRENDGVRIGVDRARGGLELAVEEFVEAPERRRIIGEVLDLHAVVADERGDAGGRGGSVHAPSVEL